MGLQRVRHNLATEHTHTHTTIKRVIATTEFITRFYPTDVMHQKSVSLIVRAEGEKFDQCNWAQKPNCSR